MMELGSVHAILVLPITSFLEHHPPVASAYESSRTQFASQCRLRPKRGCQSTYCRSTLLLILPLLAVSGAHLLLPPLFGNYRLPYGSLCCSLATAGLSLRLRGPNLAIHRSSRLAVLPQELPTLNTRRQSNLFLARVALRGHERE